MNRFARTISLLLVLCMALLALAGCSGSKQPKVDTKPVELTLLIWPTINRQAIDEVIHQYNQKHPNVRIRVRPFQTIGGSNFNLSVLEGVDIALLPRNQALMVAQAGAVRDLSAVRVPQLNDLVANLYDDLSKLDGKRFGLPFELTPSMLMMTEQAFTASGVRLPASDWTLTEFEQVLEGLKNTGQNYGISATALLAPMVGAYGGQVYDPHSGRWMLDTDEAKQGLAHMARLVQAGLISAALPGQQGAAIAGGAGAAGGQGGTPVLVAPTAGLNIRVGAMTAQQPYPKGPKGRSVPASANMAVVTAASPNGEAAIDFIREMVSSETAQTALAKGGIRPIIASNKALAAWQDTVGDKAAQKLELSLRGAHAELGINYNELIQALTPYFEGRVTLDQILPDLMARLNR